MKKEDFVLELFFNEPTKHWHFEEVIKIAKISRPQAVFWLKKLIKECIVKRVKLQKKMPYYLGNYGHPNYKIKKRLFALKKMDSTGFLKHLVALPMARNVIIFGSFSRWDWYKESDIDVFIYGNPDGLERSKYWMALHHEIQLFICKNKEELMKFNPKLLRSILEGYLVKGDFDFIEVRAHA